VVAGDDYVGVDLSLGMLREFARRRGGEPPPHLVHADGRRLPFADATFDAVMMVQVVGAARDWRRLVAEARRVLRSPGGVLAVGRSLMPPSGLDERMKRSLASILNRMQVAPYHMPGRGDVRQWREFLERSDGRRVVAEWDVRRTPRDFLSRQRTGARFSALPEPVKEEALRTLATWAMATFGSLDAVFCERHGFELRFFKHGGSL
jgi:SAM-dependent methyltransferase